MKSCPWKRRPPSRIVDDLHLRYLEASFEGFRRSAFSLMLLNAGAILALIGLFPVFASTGLDVPATASAMKCPLSWFLFGLIVSVCSLITLSLSAHSAAWGNASLEKGCRIAGIVLLLVATILFAVGAWSALDTISEPALFTGT